MECREEDGYGWQTRGVGGMDRVAMSVQEMAMQMGISLSKAYALTREADFPIVRVGKRVLVPVSEFKVWLSARATEK